MQDANVMSIALLVKCNVELDAVERHAYYLVGAFSPVALCLLVELVVHCIVRGS